jgi:hypothetical protein
VNVIRRMARHALTWRIFVSVAKVAGHTWDFDVFVAQREFGFAVVELDRSPALSVMTGATVSAQASLVRLFFLVAVEARGGSLTIGLAHFVTAGTRQRRVRAGQGKFGACVVELSDAELHDVSGSPEMLGVTRSALGLSDAWQPAVKIVRSSKIARDLLVTVEAQPRLAVRVMAVMASGALFFVLQMRGAYFAGHE